MITSNIDKYLRSWSEEFSVRSSRVRDIIGASHWLSDGQHKEIIVKEFLSDYLPNGVSVDNGFVCSLYPVMVITDKQLLQLGIVDPLIELMKNSKVELEVFGEIEPDPGYELVLKGVQRLNDFKPDAVLAVGGG